MKNGLRIVSIAALALMAFSLNQKHTSTEFETVFIGTQTWMVYNLNTTTFSDGTEILEAKTYAEWAEAAKKKTPAWCHFYNDSSGNEIIGKLYNWHAISSNHGLAPQGWRVPTNADWALMIETLGGKTEAAKRMKNKFGWVPDEQGNNESGFKALPSGSRYPDGTFGPEGIYAAWWSSTQDGANHAWVRGIGNQKGNVTIDSYHKASGFAVRCIKEDTL